MGGLYLGPGVDSLDSDYTPRICLEEKSIMPPLYEALRGSPVGTAPEGNGSLHCPPTPPPLVHVFAWFEEGMGGPVAKGEPKASQSF